MFSITVALANTQIIWTFMYKTKESADTGWNKRFNTGSFFTFADDFGQSAEISAENYGGALMEDLDQSKMAHIERAMHTERVKIQAQNAAQSDQVIKNAMRAAQRGPAIFDPTMQNGSGPTRF